MEESLPAIAINYPVLLGADRELGLGGDGGQDQQHQHQVDLPHHGHDNTELVTVY